MGFLGLIEWVFWVRSNGFDEWVFLIRRSAIEWVRRSWSWFLGSSESELESVSGFAISLLSLLSLLSLSLHV